MCKLYPINTTKVIIIILFTIFQTYSVQYPIYTSSCTTESATRLCSQHNNLTEYILSLKKGGTNILSTSDYDKNFFLCQQYTFDCGYVEDENQTVSIANGIQLSMSNTQVDTILPSSATLATNIKHYLNLTAANAKNVMKVFPLTLTSTQSDQFFTNYMNILLTQIKTKYAAQKMNGTKIWTDLNINIRTAVSQIIKEDKNLLTSSFWDDFKYNNFSQMSDYLKNQFRQTNQLYYLRSAYLIDSVTQRCNKYQSVNFLIDQSGSITQPSFKFALDFIVSYISGTNDDPNLISIHFYDSTFQPYLDYGHTKAQLLNVGTKHYRGGGTMTGVAINQTIDKILAGNFQNGLNKIMIVMTDGFSYDNVLYASNYARSKGITMIAVGIGGNVNDVQLLQICQTPSNMIKVSSYADLTKLVNFIENFFCKQIIDLKLSDTVTGNVVRVPDSPSYYRLERSATNEIYQLRINYDSDPDLKNVSADISEFDPFPDEFSYYRYGTRYKISPLQHSYFIYPQQQSELRVKKNYFTVQNFDYAFLSMGGYNIKFNISLLKCSTPDCSYQKTAYDALAAENSTIVSPDSYSNDSDISTSVYASSCPLESPSRLCPQGGNITEYLQGLKKGSTNILSVSDYNKDFFLCQQFTFDCGYVQNQNQTISISNGIELAMNATQIDTILPVNTSLASNIKTYLGLTASDAKCGMKVYPLTLTAAESDLFFTNYMNLLVTDIKTKYTAQKTVGTLAWSDLNINIKTAVSQVIKENINLMSNEFWNYFKTNNFSQMSIYLQQQYQTNNQNLYCLRSSYLIDAVTQKCNKYQSINFLIDESGSIGSANFALTLNFLADFLNATNDDPKLMSVHFYDAALQIYLDYNNTKDQLITGVKTKTYRAGGTYTGVAIRSAVDRIVSANLDQGVNKILIVITDGQSYDQVLSSANYARSQKITLIAVGVGPGTNDTQLLEIAQSSSNVIKVSSFSQLGKLSKYIGNFLCKQIIDVKFNQTITGNSVKVPQSPTYFRVEKSIANLTYELRIKYNKIPEQNNVSLYTSEYDPFPNALSQYSIPEAYKVSDYERVYYIYPVHLNEIRKKKSYFKLYYFQYSYIAVAGSSINFDISLTLCNSTACSGSRAASSIYENPKVTYQAPQQYQSFEKDLKKQQIQKLDDSQNPNAIIVLVGCFSGFIILLIIITLIYKNYCLNSQKSNENEVDNTNFDPEITQEAINNNINSEMIEKDINHFESTQQNEITN